jgi:hypothetical protein
MLFLNQNKGGTLMPQMVHLPAGEAGMNTDKNIIFIGTNYKSAPARSNNEAVRLSIIILNFETI